MRAQQLPRFLLFPSWRLFRFATNCRIILIIPHFYFARKLAATPSGKPIIATFCAHQIKVSRAADKSLARSVSVFGRESRKPCAHRPSSTAKWINNNNFPNIIGCCIILFGEAGASAPTPNPTRFNENWNLRSHIKSKFFSRLFFSFSLFLSGSREHRVYGEWMKSGKRNVHLVKRARCNKCRLEMIMASYTCTLPFYVVTSVALSWLLSL